MPRWQLRCEVAGQCPRTITAKARLLPLRSEFVTSCRFGFETAVPGRPTEHDDCEIVPTRGIPDPKLAARTGVSKSFLLHLRQTSETVAVTHRVMPARSRTRSTSP